MFASLALERRPRRVVAVEPDRRKVRAIPGVAFVIGYDESIRGTHDVVTLIDVLYKIPLSEWDPLLDRIAARLRPGGLLLVKEQDPTATIKNGWNRIQEAIASKFRLTLGESFSYEAPADFAARLERHGFTGVAVRRIDAWYPHPHVLYAARLSSQDA